MAEDKKPKAKVKSEGEKRGESPEVEKQVRKKIVKRKAIRKKAAQKKATQKKRIVRKKINPEKPRIGSEAEVDSGKSGVAAISEPGSITETESLNNESSRREEPMSQTAVQQVIPDTTGSAKGFWRKVAVATILVIAAFLFIRHQVHDGEFAGDSKRGSLPEQLSGSDGPSSDGSNISSGVAPTEPPAIAETAEAKVDNPDDAAQAGFFSQGRPSLPMSETNRPVDSAVVVGDAPGSSLTPADPSDSRMGGAVSAATSPEALKAIEQASDPAGPTPTTDSTQEKGEEDTTLGTIMVESNEVADAQRKRPVQATGSEQVAASTTTANEKRTATEVLDKDSPRDDTEAKEPFESAENGTTQSQILPASEPLAFRELFGYRRPAPPARFQDRRGIDRRQLRFRRPDYVRPGYAAPSWPGYPLSYQRRTEGTDASRRWSRPMAPHSGWGWGRSQWFGYGPYPNLSGQHPFTDPGGVPEAAGRYQPSYPGK